MLFQDKHICISIAVYVNFWNLYLYKLVSL